MIITIARESGSGGYTVGKLLSDYYHIPVHDQDSLARLAKEKGMYDEMPDFFQESPVNSIIYALSMDFRKKKFTEPERDRLEHLLPEKARRQAARKRMRLTMARRGKAGRL